MWVGRLTAAASGPASDLEAKMGPFVDLLQDCVEAVKVLYASIVEANAVDAQGNVTGRVCCCRCRYCCCGAVAVVEWCWLLGPDDEEQRD